MKKQKPRRLDRPCAKCKKTAADGAIFSMNAAYCKPCNSIAMLAYREKHGQPKKEQPTT